MALRRSKMQEKELQKLQGQMITLEQQKFLIEGSKFDMNTFEAMKAGS